MTGLEQFPVPCTDFHLFFGMKAYSIDLRERVGAACALPGVRIYRVAAQFGVSISFVDKRLRWQRTTGSVAALPPSGGPAPMRDPTGQVRLTACLNQQPDATPDELRTALAAVGGPVLSRTSVGRATQSLGWKRKKSVRAVGRDTERVVVLRQLVVEAIQ